MIISLMPIYARKREKTVLVMDSCLFQVTANMRRFSYNSYCRLSSVEYYAWRLSIIFISSSNSTPNLSLTAFFALDTSPR